MIASPQQIPLQWPPGVCRAAIFLHLLIAASALPVEVPWAAKLFVWGGVLLSAMVMWRRQKNLCGASLHPNGRVAEWRCAGEHKAGVVLANSLVIGPLMVLYWQPESGGKVSAFFLWRGAWEAQAWREVVVWLRWRVQRHVVRF